MSSVNKVIIVGNVGNDPEIRSMQSGDEVCNLSIATSDSWKDKSTGEKKEKTEWHNVVVYGGLINVIRNHVTKGSKLYIEGELQTRKWQDKNGNDRYTTEVVLRGFNSNIVILSFADRPKDNRYDEVKQAVENTQTYGGGGDFDSEIPFTRHLDFVGG